MTQTKASILVLDSYGSFLGMARAKDFIVKTENSTRKKKGKREYLNHAKTRNIIKLLNAFFESKVEISRIRVGKRQTVETLISEEALLLAKYLRNEKTIWNPRISCL